MDLHALRSRGPRFMIVAFKRGKIIDRIYSMMPTCDFKDPKVCRGSSLLVPEVLAVSKACINYWPHALISNSSDAGHG